MQQNELHIAPSNRGYYKSDLARHSLLFMLLLPCLFPAETASIILILFFIAWLLSSKTHIKKDFFPLVAPFILLLVIGAIGALQYSPIDVVKDVWYVGKVIVAIGSGYVLARFLPDFSKIYKTIVLAGAFAAVIHFVEIIAFWQSELSFFDLRANEGVRGYFITVIGFALLTALPRKLFHLNRSSSYYLISLFSLLSLMLSFSRTYIISYILLVFILKGWARVSFRSFIKIFASVVAVGLVIAIAALTQSDITGEKSLANKFINSANEVAFSDYSDMRDINLHWRGFESYRALVVFQGGSFIQKIFGQGLGATVDLGFYMNLGGSELRFIPALHNGYMYVLVKFGVIGLLVYLYFLVKMIRSISYIGRQNSISRDSLIASRLVAGMGWCLLLTTFVVAGAFNKSAMLPTLIILGLLVGLAHHRK